MKTRGLKMEPGGWRSRSVLECGDSSPLSIRVALPPKQKRRRVGAVQTLARVSALICLSFAASSSVQARSYSIDWSTMDGGGTSTGGLYSVGGTIGQPDAGTMSGLNYTSEGGFWGVIATVQTVGAPLLSLWRTTTTAVVSWPSPSTGWNLQQNTNSVSSVNRSNVTDTIQDDGTTRTLIVNPPTGNRFYRLHKP